MTSKTPKFDAALNEHFSKLTLDEKGGLWRICRWSGEKFYIKPEDIAFYKRIGVPLPTLAPAERWRRLLAYQNAENLYRVKSAHSGKSIIAAYPPNTPFKIYEHQTWFSDAWDPRAYGQRWDSAKSFAEQFAKLEKDVPQPNLVTDTSNIGSEYTNTSTNLKNCYLTFNTLSGENLHYFNCCDGSKDCMDSSGLFNCDMCFRCQEVWDSYRCFFCEQSRQSLESYFLYDCRGCTHCFMCANLRNKKYYFRNTPLSKEMYEQKMKEVYLGSHKALRQYLEEYQNLKKSALHKQDHNFRAINSFGDWIYDSKNCYWSCLLFECQNVNYSEGLMGYKDCYDIVGGAGGELCYELMSVSTKDNYQVQFASQLDNCRSVAYSDLCRNCHDCFGCIGLNNKAFCIFNTAYNETEYWEIIDGIKTAMLERGEYGEFFPPGLAPVPYKTSLAATYPGFSDFENARKYGYDISDIPQPAAEFEGDVVPSSKLPDDITDATDNLLQKVIHDEQNNKYFRLTPFELAFYRKHRLALPREHPLVRLKRFNETYDLRMTFYDRTCLKCGVPIRSAFDPAVYKNVLCEKCYNNEVV